MHLYKNVMQMVKNLVTVIRAFVLGCPKYNTFFLYEFWGIQTQNMIYIHKEDDHLQQIWVAKCMCT